MNVKPIKTPLQMFDDFLAARGLTGADVNKLGWILGSPEDCQRVLGMRCYDSGVIMPYPGEDYVRVRILGNSKIRYLSRKGSGSGPLYLPYGPDWGDVKADSTVDIAIVEGETKSYCGQRMSPKTLAWIGIGGVDMQGSLTTSDIEWRGRRVFICFDKDTGYETGVFKPEVGRALRRLATKLISAGAVVYIMNIPGKKDEKLGLDDYLLAGGGLEELVAGATTPPEDCVELAWFLDNCILVAGTNNAHVYNLADKSEKSLTDFHTTYRASRHMSSGGPGAKPKMIYHTEEWMYHKDRQTVRAYTVDPSSTEVVVYKNGVADINMWTPYPTFDASSAPQMTTLPGGAACGVKMGWQHFCQGLFGEHWKWVACWAAHTLLRPEERCAQAVMVGTKVRGVGKSLFGETMVALCGDEHGAEVDPDALFSKFNSVMKSKTFVLVNELDSLFSAKESQFNNLITTDKCSIEDKGKDVKVLPNFRRFYLTFNAAVPMRLTAGQRRYFICTPPRVDSDTRGPWGVWVRTVVAKWKRNPAALGQIREWLEEQLAEWEEEHGRWDPTAPVIETEESLEIAEASMTGNQIIAAEAIKWLQEHGGLGAVRPINVRSKRKAMQELLSTVKALGGQVGKKTVKDNGITSDYFVFSVGRAASEWEKTPKGETKSLLSPEEIRAVADQLWQVIGPLINEFDSGNKPKF